MDMKKKIEEAVTVANQLANVYYGRVDTQRILVGELYLDTGALTWNGNVHKGREAIKRFFVDFPASEHSVQTVNAQPILGSAVNGQLTFLIQVTGTVKYPEMTPKSFQQTFVVVPHANSTGWAIVTDNFRINESLNTKK